MSLELYKNFKPGAPKRYENAEQLYRACLSYFRAIDENPWKKNEAIKSGPMAGQLVEVPTPTPYTMKELQLYIGVHRNYFGNLRADKNLSEDFRGVMEWAQEICDTQKFKGAAVGAFNANIISRDLGLVDKQEHKSIIEIVDPEENSTDEDPDAN